MTPLRFVVSGIGTDVGKTVVSALLVEALKAAYWKPVQAGDLDNSDSMKVARWAEGAHIFPEAFRLTKPMSPHAAAAADGIEIDLENLSLPEAECLIVEGAGGLMVPINDRADTFLDAIAQWQLPVVLVSRHYLGSINHTLLSLEALSQRGIALHGVVFIGNNPQSEEIICRGGQLKRWITISEVPKIDESFIRQQAERLRAFILNKEYAG